MTNINAGKFSSINALYSLARPVAIFIYLSNKPFNYAMDIRSLISESFICRSSKASLPYVLSKAAEKETI